MQNFLTGVPLLALIDNFEENQDDGKDGDFTSPKFKVYMTQMMGSGRIMIGRA